MSGRNGRARLRRGARSAGVRDSGPQPHRPAGGPRAGPGVRAPGAADRARARREGVHLRAPRRQAGRPRRRAVLDASRHPRPARRQDAVLRALLHEGRPAAVRPGAGRVAGRRRGAGGGARAAGARAPQRHRRTPCGAGGLATRPRRDPRGLARPAGGRGHPRRRRAAVAREGPRPRARGLRGAATTPPGAALAPHLLRRRAAGRLARATHRRPPPRGPGHVGGGPPQGRRRARRPRRPPVDVHRRRPAAERDRSGLGGDAGPRDRGGRDDRSSRRPARRRPGSTVGGRPRRSPIGWRRCCATRHSRARWARPSRRVWCPDSPDGYGARGCSSSTGRSWTARGRAAVGPFPDSAAA